MNTLQIPTPLHPVDHSSIRTNQAFVIGLSVLAFILDLPWLAGFVASVMLLGTVLKQPGFGFFYRLVLKPLGVVRPDVLPDNPEPHRFAQGFGGLVLLAGFGGLLAGLPVLGWTITWLSTLRTAPPTE